jgi:hypothetical protein
MVFNRYFWMFWFKTINYIGWINNLLKLIKIANNEV